MNGRQDQIVLVELRAAGFGAAGIGWVQCQLGQKTLAGEIAGGDLLELVEVSGARRRLPVRPRKFCSEECTTSYYSDTQFRAIVAAIASRRADPKRSRQISPSARR